MGTSNEINTMKVWEDSRRCSSCRFRTGREEMIGTATVVAGDGSFILAGWFVDLGRSTGLSHDDRETASANHESFPSQDSNEVSLEAGGTSKSCDEISR